MVFRSLYCERWRYRSALLVACLLSGITLMSFCAGHSEGDDERNAGRKLHAVGQYIRHIHRSRRTPQGSPTLAFMLRFSDFGCVPCLNNFLDFCETLNATTAIKGKKEILLVFLRDNNREQHQRATLQKWAKINALPFPIYLAPEEVYVRYHIGHSSVVLINETDTVDFTGELPLPAESQEIILHRLFGDR